MVCSVARFDVSFATVLSYVCADYIGFSKGS